MMLKRGLWGRRFTNMRWSRYLRLLMESSGASVGSIARATGEGTERIRQWKKTRPARGPKATTAFEVGNALRRELHLPTSGMECLYAYGYWTELFELLKHISVDHAHNGQNIAFSAYCVLPDVRFENLVFQEALDQLAPDRREFVETCHSRDLALIIADAGSPRQSDERRREEKRQAELESLRNPATINLIENAWYHVGARLQPTGAGQVDEESLAIIDAVISLSKNEIIREAPPTIVGVRLWRMLAEWANAFGAADDWLLPDVFITSGAVRERKHYEELEMEEMALQAAFDQWRGK